MILRLDHCCGACRDEQVSGPALDAVRHVLADGSWPELALEAVQLVADLIRKRKCSCSPQVQPRACKVTLIAIQSALFLTVDRCRMHERTQLRETSIARLMRFQTVAVALRRVTRVSQTMDWTLLCCSLWTGPYAGSSSLPADHMWCSLAVTILYRPALEQVLEVLYVTPAGRGDHDGGEAARARRTPRARRSTGRSHALQWRRRWRRWRRRRGPSPARRS